MKKYEYWLCKNAYWYTLIFFGDPVLALRDHTLGDHNACIHKDCGRGQELHKQLKYQGWQLMIYNLMYNLSGGQIHDPLSGNTTFRSSMQLPYLSHRPLKKFLADTTPFEGPQPHHLHCLQNYRERAVCPEQLTKTLRVLRLRCWKRTCFHKLKKMEAGPLLGSRTPR